MRPAVRSYIEWCPIGCRTGFATTPIVLREGPLRQCLECGQLVSACSEAWYWESMKEFEVVEGTFPGQENLERHMYRSGKILRKIAKAVKKKQDEIDLLDVGCSSGSFLVVARDLGFRVAGVEPAAAPARRARERQLNVYQGFLEELFLAEGSYDAVTLFEVVEHVKDPVRVVKECHRVLRPGGIVVIRTGNTDSWTVRYMGGRWEYFDISRHGGHVSFFNPESIRVLAERSGFKIASLKTRNLRLYEKHHCSVFRYRIAKICSEILNGFARLIEKGHDMLVFLRKVDGSVGQE